jgi:hypothetical protein
MKPLLLAMFVLFGAGSLLYSQQVDSISVNILPDSALLSNKPDSVRQTDLVDYLVKIFRIKNSEERRNDRKVRFSLFPSRSAAGGDKTAFTSFNIAFLLGDLKDTKVSNIYFYPYIGFGGQYGFQIQPNLWSKKNSWNFIGEYFILNYPQNTWGLGGNSLEENLTMIDYDHLRIHQNVMKGILPNLSVGLGYAYDKHYNIVVEESDYSSVISGYMPENKDHTVSSGITLPVMYDLRKNQLNPQGGFMAGFTYSFYHPFLGSDDKWQSVIIDTRKYFRFHSGKYKILALRSYYWTIVSGKTPYLDLPANRWEPVPGSSSRGIRQNRYRSNALLYFESEFRFGITANGFLGGVIFANLTSASEYDTQQFRYWHPAAGTGIRLKFNKYSNTNVTFDAGFSKEFWSVYLNIGEAF